MPSIAEMVEEEAAAAEAEAKAAEPEPEPGPGPEPEPQEREQQAFVAIGEKEIKQAERARDAYRKRIGSILGDEAVVHECLLCAGLGYLPDLPPPGTQFGIALGEDGPALVASEPLSEPEYVAALDKAECPECQGLGLVKTGAKTEHGRIAPCSKCSGNGWVMIARAEPLAAGISSTTPPPVAADGSPAIQLGPDAWGRPFGHKHWGVPPAQIPG